jgi:hypothetical protein
MVLYVRVCVRRAGAQSLVHRGYRGGATLYLRDDGGCDLLQTLQRVFADLRPEKDRFLLKQTFSLPHCSQFLVAGLWTNITNLCSEKNSSSIFLSPSLFAFSPGWILPLSAHLRAPCLFHGRRQRWVESFVRYGRGSYLPWQPLCQTLREYLPKSHECHCLPRNKRGPR